MIDSEKFWQELFTAPPSVPVEQASTLQVVPVGCTCGCYRLLITVGNRCVVADITKATAEAIAKQLCPTLTARPIISRMRPSDN